MSEYQELSFGVKDKDREGLQDVDMFTNSNIKVLDKALEQLNFALPDLPVDSMVEEVLLDDSQLMQSTNSRLLKTWVVNLRGSSFQNTPCGRTTKSTRNWQLQWTKLTPKRNHLLLTSQGPQSRLKLRATCGSPTLQPISLLCEGDTPVTL